MVGSNGCGNCGNAAAAAKSRWLSLIEIAERQRTSVKQAAFTNVELEQPFNSCQACKSTGRSFRRNC